MKTHNIPLSSFKPTGKVKAVMDSGILSLTSINMNHHISIPYKPKLPFCINMELNTNVSDFFVGIGKGGVGFSGHINLSGGGIRRVDIFTGKKETVKFDYDNELPLNKYFNLSLVYDSTVTWLKVNNNYCYALRNAPYISLFKNGSLPDEFNDGLELYIWLGKKNNKLSIKSFFVNEYKDEMNIPAEIENLLALSPFEIYLRTLPHEMRAEAVDYWKKKKKFIRKEDDHGETSYTVPGEIKYKKQEIKDSGQTQIKWIKCENINKHHYTPDLAALNVIDVRKREDYVIGGIISFGAYYWRILDKKNNAALIITEEITEQRPYHDAYVDITWADCALREYLNNEFYNKFSASDKARIKTVTNKNPDNPWYGTTGGTDTQDKIFILSLEEAVCKYFGDSSKLLYNPRKNQKYWFERKDENNEKRGALFKGSSWWYWLRTPGRNNVKAVYCGDGGIGIQGNNILKSNVAVNNFHQFGNNHGGVRPALWLKIV